MHALFLLLIRSILSNDNIQIAYSLSQRFKILDSEIQCPDTQEGSIFDITDKSDGNEKEYDLIYACGSQSQPRISSSKSRVFTYSCKLISLSDDSNGGAIYLHYINILRNEHYKIIKCNFSHCRSENGGAISFNDNKCNTLEVIDTVFEHNYASNQGGALYMVGSRLIYEGYTFYDDIAGEKGDEIYFSFTALYCNDGNPINFNMNNNEIIRTTKEDQASSLFFFVSVSQTKYNFNFIDNNITLYNQSDNFYIFFMYESKISFNANFNNNFIDPINTTISNVESLNNNDGFSEFPPPPETPTQTPKETPTPQESPT